MANWHDAGGKPETKTSWADRGDHSILEVITVIDDLVREGEAIVAIMVDRKVRAALEVMKLDMDMMSTETFIIWMSGTFGIKQADTARHTIRSITGESLPRLRADDDEPVRTSKAKRVSRRSWKQ